MASGMALSQTALTRPMRELAASFQDVVWRQPAGAVPIAVARRLAPRLGSPELLADEHLEADPRRYRQHIVYVAPDGAFSIVALVWLPGQATPIHDHVSWCVVGVHRGAERETKYALADDGGQWLVERGEVINGQGSIAALQPPGDIHRVACHGAELTVSVHVYGADIGRLGSSIRRVYELPVRSRS
jgi:predicted metal-dependent enzyme (double-stranded beta helix superfamily)